MIACFTGGSSALASLPPAGVSAGREARPARAAALVGHRDRRGQHGPQARLGVQGRPAGGGGAARDADQPDRLRRRRRPHRRDHRPDASRQTRGRRRDRRPPRHTASGTRTPRSIREHLAAPDAESPDLDPDADPDRRSWSPARPPATRWRSRRPSSASTPVVVSTSLEGEARQVGKLLANLARHSAADARPVRARHGDARLRRREHRDPGPRTPPSARAARTRRRRSPRRSSSRASPVAAIFLDTDGSDGGTEHAGAIVDGLDRRARRGGRARPAGGAARAPVAGRARGARGRARHRADRDQRQRPVRDRDQGGRNERGADDRRRPPGQGLRRRPRGRRRHARDPGGRVLLDAGPERLRQDDDAAGDRRASRRPTPAGSCSTART